MLGLSRFLKRTPDEQEEGTLILDKPSLPRRVAGAAANQEAKVRSDAAPRSTVRAAIPALSSKPAPSLVHESANDANPQPMGRPALRSVVPAQLAQKIGIELPLIEQAAQLPAFKDVLTKTGGVLSLGINMQIRMVALLIEGKSICLICADGSQESDAFRTLATKAEREGYEITLRLRAHTAVIASLHDIDARRNSARGNSVEVDGRNSPAVGYLTEMIRDAVGKGATDVHVTIDKEGGTDKATIKFRVHTKMRAQKTNLSREQVEEMIAVAYQFCNEEGSTSAVTWNPQMNPSAMIKVELGAGNRVRLRMQCNKVVGGYHVVYRILHDESGKTVSIKSLAELGYSPSQCRDISIAARSSSGMTLVSGVTGSGKSTTLKTVLAHHPYKNDIEIYSVEDPVEYRIPGVHQITVQRSANEVLQGNKSDVDPFHVAVKNLLRSDPDAAMLGEIRDEFTAESAASLVDTGHQVYGTVHADSWSGTVGRLASRNIGLYRDRMTGPNFFSALMYQKLVPLLCPHCKVPAAKVVTDELISEIQRFEVDIKSVFVQSEVGCEECKQVGTSGMTVVAEVVCPDSELRSLLAEGKDSEAYDVWRARRTAAFTEANCDSKTALEHAIYKMSQGKVDPRDIESTFYPFARHEICERTTSK